MHGVLPGCPRCWINLKNIPQPNSLDSSLSPVTLRKLAKLARDATALTIVLNPQRNCMTSTNASASFPQDCAANETDSEKTKQPGTFLWHVPRSSQHMSTLFWPSHFFFFPYWKGKKWFICDKQSDVFLLLPFLCSFPATGLLRVVEPLSKRSVELSAAVFPQKAGRLMELHSVLAEWIRTV